VDAGYTIRSVNDGELPDYGQVGLQAFVSPYNAEDLVELDRLVREPDRMLGAFDGDRHVGSAFAYSFEMTVPGGTVPTAGVSGVAVLPSHRRRGILSALMRRQLADIAAGDEPVAALFASEAPIYGRFGYGMAAAEYDFRISRSDARGLLADEGSSKLTLSLARPREAIEQMQAVYDEICPSRPGMMARNEQWWQAQTADPEFARNGRTPLACVIASDDSGARGYALYSGKGGWDEDGIPDGKIFVRELFGIDAAAIAAIWADLLSRDLTGEVTARMRATDDPLPYLLGDSRRVRTKIGDGLWVRLVDVPAALRRRRYASDAELVIEVTDSLLAANQGRWRLRTGGRSGDAACEQTADEPDLALPVSVLGAAYLGGSRLGVLAGIGRITEFRPGAVSELSAAMWWDPAPWSPMMF
jgi:predicted acetyltransferase